MSTGRRRAAGASDDLALDDLAMADSLALDVVPRPR
jgi:hypothetical protein